MNVLNMSDDDFLNWAGDVDPIVKKMEGEKKVTALLLQVKTVPITDKLDELFYTAAKYGVEDD